MTAVDEYVLEIKQSNRIQNELTVVTRIKPGLFRYLMLRAVLWLIGIVAKLERGPLVGIPTIHFARWVILDDGKRLLFTSNYDGLWERYIDDFIDKAAVGMTWIWRNCEGFPPTNFWGTKGGARDVKAFKQYILDHQIIAQVFYRAYPDLTVDNLLNDNEIVETFEKIRSQKSVNVEELDKLMRLL